MGTTAVVDRTPVRGSGSSICVYCGRLIGAEAFATVDTFDSAIGVLGLVHRTVCADALADTEAARRGLWGLR